MRRDRLAEPGPDAVVVDAAGHHVDQHVVFADRPGRHHLELHRGLGRAVALLADHPRVHLRRHVTERRDFSDLVQVFHRRCGWCASCATDMDDLAGWTPPRDGSLPHFIVRRNKLPVREVAVDAHGQTPRPSANADLFASGPAAVHNQVAGRNRRHDDCQGYADQARQAVDLPHLCGPFHRGRVERALPQQPRQGPDRPFGRLRSADPDRLRQRPSARQRRGRQSRRADLASRRHAGAVRRHPARRDEHLDDDQRDGRLAARALHRGGGRARRGARQAARARPRTTSSRNISRAAPTCSRRRRPCGSPRT